jgi:hypothetical protein
MDQKECDRLMLFRDAIEDAGVARQAQEDALRRLETHFVGQEPDSTDVHSYARGELKRVAPHFWRQDTPGTSTMPAPGQDGREACKGASQVDVQLTEEEQKKLPHVRMTIARERQAAARRGQP